MSGGPEWEGEQAPTRPPDAPQPMRLGTVIEVGFRIIRRHWGLLLLTALVSTGPGALLLAATQLRFNEVALDLFPSLGEGVIETDVTVDPAELDRLIDALLPFGLATLVAGVLASIGALAFSAVVADDYHAREPETGDVLRRTLRRVPSALVFILASSLVVAGVGFLGLLGIGLVTTILPPAAGAGGGPGVFIALVIAVALVLALVYLTMRWAPAFPAMIEEEVGWRGAFSRSWHLSGDNVWRIFAIALVATIVTIIGAAVVSQLLVILLAGVVAPALGFDELVAESVSLAVGSTLLAPLAPVLTAVLYFDLRTRRDPPPEIDHA